MKPSLDNKGVEPGASIPSEAMMLFPQFQIPSPYFRKNVRLRWKFCQFYLSPKFFLDFHQLQLSDDLSPYFDHDAFMHHTMHVLDAPE